MKVFLTFLIIGILAVAGCIQREIKTTPKEELAREKCIELCLKANRDLSNGPCLSDDNIEWNIEDWVCDVAHSPRESVDNQPENQCKAYREGKAHHFVEVNPECKFIKAI
ncbi:MAG: hypothetical protein QW051_00890 [Candidatus Aenigmatarchaeota archaeon]